MLNKRHKSCKRNIHELCDSIKRPNLWIESLKEEVQANGIPNIFNKEIAENLPNLQKEMLIQVQEDSRTTNRHE
jgi:hypothetical protein